MKMTIVGFDYLDKCARWRIVLVEQLNWIRSVR